MHEFTQNLVLNEDHADKDDPITASSFAVSSFGVALKDIRWRIK